MRAFKFYQRGSFDIIETFGMVMFLLTVSFMSAVIAFNTKTISQKLDISQTYQSGICTLLDGKSTEISPDGKLLSCKITGDRLSNTKGAPTTANPVSLDDLYRHHWRVVTSFTHHTAEAGHIIYIIEKRQ